MSLNLKAITSAMGYQQLTGLTTATRLTVPTRDINGLSVKPAIAIITCEVAGVRWRDDKIAPTATVGMPMSAGVTLQYDGDLNSIQFIQQSAGAIVNVSYYA